MLVYFNFKGNKWLRAKLSFGSTSQWICFAAISELGSSPALNSPNCMYKPTTVDNELPNPSTYTPET